MLKKMSRRFVFVFLLSGIGMASAQNIIPKEVRVDTVKKPALLRQDTAVSIDNIVAGYEKKVFNCINGGDYYVAFELYYDLSDFNTVPEWSAEIEVLFKYNGATLSGWSGKTLKVNSKSASASQVLVATLFHDSWVTCSNLYTVRVNTKQIFGPVPQNKIFFKRTVLRKINNNYQPSSASNLVPTVSGNSVSVTWNPPSSTESVQSYDLEWVYINNSDGLNILKADTAFRKREPVRVTVPNASYNHSIYYPSGKIWYRVRPVGFNPSIPGHRIPGNWIYSADAGISISNHQANMNWQEQTVFAEEGKYKKVMTYYDGTLRQRQALTNLSTDNLTLLSESRYDFEGRKSVEILPAPVSQFTDRSFPVTKFTGTGANLTISSNTITKNAGSGTAWTGTFSTDKIQANESGWVEIEILGITGTRAFGLAPDNPNTNFNTIDYAFYTTGSTLRIYENGTQRVVTLPTLAVGNKLRIERIVSGSTVTVNYRLNGVIQYTSTIPGSASTVLYGDFSINTAATAISNIKMSNGGFDYVPTLAYTPTFNTFQAVDNQVGTIAAIPNYNKFHYDNKGYSNSIVSSLTGSSRYYSLRPINESIHSDYIPDAEGYVYSQTEYLDDGTGRVSKQSGVGKAFAMDGSHVTKSFYASPDPVEVVRLFGSNVGNANHYKKNLVIDPNGQASVTYLDQEDRVIATALAGAAPNNVLPLSIPASDSNYVNLKFKNKKADNASTVTQRFIKSGNAPIIYRFVYDLSSFSSQIPNVACVSCSYDLRITLKDPDGKAMLLNGSLGNEALPEDTAYVRNNLSTNAANCSTLQNLTAIVLKPNLIKPGTYTFTKTLTAREQTFEQVKTVVSQTATVLALIDSIKNDYPLDPTQCDICTTCSTGTIIQDAIDEIVDQDCENIKERIRQALIAANSTNPNYVATDSIVALQPGYCEYELCVANKPSNTFETGLARISTWTEASGTTYNFGGTTNGYLNILNSDPFFTTGAIGFEYKASMQAKLNDVFVANIIQDANNDKAPDGLPTAYRGTILNVTNPTDNAYFLRPDGSQGNGGGANPGLHMLYYDLGQQLADDQITLNIYNQEVDKQRWLLFKSFYMEAKRKTKLEIPDFQNCDSTRVSLEAQDNLPTDEKGIELWGIQNGVLPNGGLAGPVSDAEVSAVTANFKLFCSNLTPADTVIIFNSLKAYFTSKPENFLRLILQEDLCYSPLFFCNENPNLTLIKNTLSNRGCSIDSLVEVSPISCVTSRSVTYVDNPYYQEEYKTSTNGGAANCTVPPNNNNCAAQYRTGYSDIVGAATTTALPTYDEYKALMKFYGAIMDSQGWPTTIHSTWDNAYTLWSSGDSTVQCVSGWFGITTDIQGHVIALQMPQSKVLNRYLPKEIGDLTYLQVLDLSGPIKGVIPEEITNLTNLKLLFLLGNVTGALPRNIGNMVSLEHLNLDFNSISGTIPESIGNCVNLKGITMFNNKLSGSIPASMGNLTQLTTLSLDANKLTGIIPIEFGNFACNSCVYISLTNNDLSGVVPYKLRNVWQLHLNGNRFTIGDFKYVKQNWWAGASSFWINSTPQDSVDVKRTIKAVKTSPLTLTTYIDLNVSAPPCKYRWYKDGVPITSKSSSPTSRTYSISSVNDGHAGNYYYYIYNDAMPNDSIVSYKIKVIPVTSNTRTLELCTSWDTSNPTLKAWTFEVTQAVWDSVIQRCLKRQIQEDSTLIAHATNILIDSVATEYYSKSSTNCLANLQENISYTYKPTEYHYTLYYYDQAGNLVQTVPPSGVRPMGQDSVNQVLNGGPPLYPQHSLVTRYRFNSLNQSSWQNTPDAATSQFWYNNKGQLRLSQNAQQLKDAKYSYTKYDMQGRITEVGELYTTQPIAVLTDSLERSSKFPVASAAYALHDYTRTYYDDKCNCANASGFAQDNLRSRVSYVEVFEKNATDTLATFYSYDIHGNVKALLQHIPKLGNKRTDYQYDLVSGKVNYVIYQYNKPDQFIHRYEYDADNRIREVFTSVDGWLWDRDALYMYYAHGPLARVQIGPRLGVQGLDYYYTLQGWIKGVNMPYDYANELGKDGYSTSTLGPRTGRDVFAYTLGYYNKDYKPRGGSSIVTADTRDKLWTQYASLYTNPTDTGYYNGNIAWMLTDLKRMGQAISPQVTQNRKKGMQAMLYQYDQLHRIRTSLSLTNYVGGTTGFSARTAVTPAAYDEKFTYDPNGNILTLQRRDQAAALVDDFNYTYYSGTNKLRFVKTPADMDYAGTITQDGKLYEDITIQPTANVASGTSVTIKATKSIKFNVQQGQTWDLNSAPNTNFRAYVIGEDEGTFNYDAIGNLIADQEQGTTITWTPYGKIRTVTKADGSTLSFRYDATGNRIEKRSVLANNTGTVTRYVRDASGNVMAVYSSAITTGTEGASALSEQPIYGSARLGMYKGGRTAGVQKLGMKNYELSNHLGNVLSVITDQLNIAADSAWADVVNAGDYYAFGGDMPGRSFPVAGGQEGAYRYGFNGKEHDTDQLLGNTSYDFGERLYNPRFARWFKVDPHAHRYISNSPYSFVNNSPIQAIELDGRDWFILAWQPEAGLNQGHTAIAISNYKKNSEGKMIPDGTYTVYEARELGNNELMGWINNPSKTVPGQVVSSRVMSKDELKTQQRFMGVQDRVDGVVEFKSDYTADNAAKSELDKMVTKFRIVPNKNIFDQNDESRVAQNPIQYSLTTDNSAAFNCSGFVAKMAKKLYNVDLGAPENVNFNGRTILAGKTGKIAIPSMNVNSYTPGSVFRGGVKAGGKVLLGAKYSFFFNSFDGYGKLDKPFIDAVTGDQLTDKNPKN